MLRPKWCVYWTACKSIILAVIRDFLMNCRSWPVEPALKSLWCEGRCELSVCGVKSAHWLMPLTGLSTSQWSVVSGHWSVVNGHWSVICGHWSVVSGQWSVVSGHWSLVTGQWSVVSGHWSVICGQWSVVSGQWSVVTGQWSVICGQWSLVIDLWSEVSGHWSLCVCVCVWQERTTDDCKESECLKELLSARTHEYIEEVLQPHFGGMITFVKDCEVAAERGNVDHLKAQESQWRP